jgi:hypothetical protein
MKIPHAVALHAIQVLPALAWLLSFSALTERVRLRLVILATAGYTGLLLVNILQTFRGLAPLTLDITALVALVLSLSLLLGVAVMTLINLFRRQPGGATSSTPPSDTGRTSPGLREEPTT